MKSENARPADRDARFMREAYALAVRGLGHTRPNPAVGAVVVANGEVIGRGWHRRCGGDHAEVAAIKDAVRRLRRRGSSEDALAGCELFVTLEPCSRAGRVGACTDAIAAARVSRVIYAVGDPNPTNRGKAKRALAKHDIACERLTGDARLLADCRGLIAGFRKHVATGLPYVTVKLAMSLDGRICDNLGDSNWITCTMSRDRTNELRARVDAIMVGAETVRKDDPSLLARVRPNGDLIRVIISKSGRIPKRAQVLTDGRNQTLVFDDAQEALRELGRRGVTSVLCEGGLKLAASLADAGLVDEWITVTAPVVIGSRPLSGALRGMSLSDASFLADGDSFHTAVLSEFAFWSGCGSGATHLDPPKRT